MEANYMSNMLIFLFNIIVSDLISVVGWLKKSLKPVQRFRENLLLYTGPTPFEAYLSCFFTLCSPNFTHSDCLWVIRW